jgi:GNAT superfamily N-acetyltransferase
MPLPVLPSSAAVSGGDLLRYFHRTELDWAGHLAADRTSLPAGTALVNPALPSIPEANSVLEAAIPAGMDPQAAIDEVLRFYQGQNAICRRWIPNNRDADSAPLAKELSGRGFSLRRTALLRLGGDVVQEPRQTNVIVIPARAAYRQLMSLAAAGAAERGIDVAQFQQAVAAHLDDPAVDALLALEAGVAVGWVAVLPNGEVGRFAELWVAPDVRGRGIGTLLARRAIDYCGRALFKHVLASFEDQATARLLQGVGFTPVGAEFVQYVLEPSGRKEAC